MATASSAGAGSAMANLNRGPRNMSAGDWIRIQRLKASKGYALTTMGIAPSGGDATAAIYPRNKDIAPQEALEQPRSQALLIPYEAAGTSRILRPASEWTSFIGSQTADYITTGIGAVNTTSVVQTRNTICNPSVTTTIKKAVNPGVNQFARQKILS
jgi:hypothetical protein